MICSTISSARYQGGGTSPAIIPSSPPNPCPVMRGNGRWSYGADARGRLMLAGRWGDAPKRIASLRYRRPVYLTCSVGWSSARSPTTGTDLALASAALETGSRCPFSRTSRGSWGGRTIGRDDEDAGTRSSHDRSTLGKVNQHDLELEHVEARDVKSDADQDGRRGTSSTAGQGWSQPFIVGLPVSLM